MRLGDDAAWLQKQGRELKKNFHDGFDEYTCSYHVEDPEFNGKVWRVDHKQAKDGD